MKLRREVENAHEKDWGTLDQWAEPNKMIVTRINKKSFFKKNSDGCKTMASVNPG